MTKRKRGKPKKKKTSRPIGLLAIITITIALLVFFGAMSANRSPDEINVESETEGRETLLTALDRYTAEIEQENNPQTYLERAKIYYQIGDFEAAVADYSVAIDAEPDNHEAWYRRGLVFDAIGDTANAIADLKRAIDLDSQPKYHRALGNVYYQAERPDEALIQYEAYVDSVRRPDENVLARIAELE